MIVEGGQISKKKSLFCCVGSLSPTGRGYYWGGEGQKTEKEENGRLGWGLSSRFGNFGDVHT